MKHLRNIMIIATVVVFTVIFNTRVIAADFPSSIKSKVDSYSDLLGQSIGWRLYKKSYSSSSASGKAFCTAFHREPSDGVNCKPIAWSSNSAMNERVSVMIGTIINSVRDSSGSISWDNYYYTELAINRLLYYGYTGNKGYGSKYNDLTGLPTNNPNFNNTKYQKLLSLANYTYNNYGNTKMQISSTKFANRLATAKVTCTDYKGASITCDVKNAKFSYKVDGGSWQTINANYDSNTKTISASIPNDLDYGNLSMYFTASDNRCWKTAQNYSCGDYYQSLVPNYLVDICKTMNAKSPVITNNSYKLEVHKRDSSDNPLNGASVLITKDGQTYLDENNGYVELVNGAVDFDNVEAGEYCVTEVKAPIGYRRSEANQCVTIDQNNPTGTITITNSYNPKTLTINKVDQDGNAVVGAKIRVTDIECLSELADTDDTASCAVGDYTTDGNAITVSNLLVGKTYVVSEEELPKDGGYAGGITAVEVTIIDGDNVVTLVNKRSSIKISKQSITSSKELPGAKLTVTDAQGNVVASWESTDKPQEITGLSDGDYTLTETTAPKGYTVAESIKFTIEDGKLKGDDDNTLVMKDATIVDVPDTFTVQNIITMFSGLVLVGLGTGVLFYETKKKKKA